MIAAGGAGPAGRGGHVVLGIGNTLLGDDGIGPRVIQELSRMSSVDPLALPPGVRLVDGGTRGIELVAELADARALVLIDAVDAGRRPGTVRVLRGEAVRDDAGRAIDRLLAAAVLTGRTPAHIALVGVQAARVAVEPRLSGPMEDAVPRVLEAVRRELWAMAATESIGVGEGEAVA